MATEKQIPVPSGENDAFLKAKGEALKLLSFKARSVEEMRKRLKIKRYPDDLVDRVIAEFSRTGLLDDRKYAKLFANAAIHSRPVGRRQMQRDLQKKGVPEEAIRQTLSELDEYDEKKAAKDLVRGRFERMKGLPDEKIKARLFGFLSRRGFSSATVYGVVADLFKEVALEAPEDIE